MSWHGNFCWYELMASDLDAAQAFYTDVVGWTIEPSGMPDGDYRLFLADGVRNAGLTSAMPDGAPQSWVGYVAIDDCDAIADIAISLGGTIHREPADIPGIGRFAVLADPQGAVFAIIAPIAPDDGIETPDPTTPGRCGWHELHSSDADAAWGFYEELLGWEKGEGLDMGPAGTYQMFRPAEATRDIGGMMTNADAPHPFWMFYFSVAALGPAVERANKGGAKLMNGPMEVPGGQWIANFLDPAGAPFSLVASGQ
ncbi:VOC family protein [Sphingomonas nostoxanthinifaciens]|uniref:VOC family protein n=1 Tax=Sphingomonas nostoxanthinifaciens TaxID=2872652 RepID=UPI001CC21479|nr:VOC family protein [Sphingomonas nostoxanthinifaciens]UAK23621.1 VOC family protein [Sphingomonas nostoxanthinifaciens]